MKLNFDCVRDILLPLEGEPLHCRVDPVNELPARLPGYSEDDVFYSVKALLDDRFVEGSLTIGCQDNWVFTPITGITTAGHRFLDAIRPQPVWDRVKEKAKTVGASTLGFLSGAASAILAEFLSGKLT